MRIFSKKESGAGQSAWIQAITYSSIAEV